MCRASPQVSKHTAYPIAFGVPEAFNETLISNP